MLTPIRIAVLKLALCLALPVAAATDDEIAVDTAAPVPARPALVQTDAPALAIGLNGITDWTTQHPFIDLFKTSRPWVGHLPGRWGGITADELRAAGHIDKDGWPLSIPDNAERIEALLLTAQQEDATHLRGYYILTFDGKGDLSLAGNARRVATEPGRLRFFYSPGPGAVGVSIDEIDPDDPIRNIAIYKEDHAALHAAGAIFNPDWLRRIADVRLVRFMDWMQTNNSTVSGWDDRPRITDATYSEWGVPLPVMIRLANEIGADPWFTLPHQADDDYVRRFAETVRDTLDPRLKAHVEYSNEVWNGVFQQGLWANDQATRIWGETADGRTQYYGFRAAQVMDMFTEVFGAAATDRLTRVFATHTGWLGLEQQALNAPLAFLGLGRMPKESFDAYAVTGYFFHEAKDENAERLRDLLDASEARAEADGRAQGLSRVALREFVRERRFTTAFAPLAKIIEEDSIRRLVDEIFPYHAEAAANAGLDLIMYEGGSHLTAVGADLDEEQLTDFLTAFASSDEMGALYTSLLSGWTAAGGRLFNAFVDVAVPSKFGIWGALPHLSAETPRWDALQRYNVTAPVPDMRPESVFANGALAAGTNAADDIGGSPEEDVILAGAGDDLIRSGGGADVIDGGPGTDTVILPGQRRDYTLTDTPDGRTLAQAGWRRILMTNVEELRFEDTPGTRLTIP
ncbi:calcium-binding protein [Roseivivax sp. CAU 1753]